MLVDLSIPCPPPSSLTSFNPCSHPLLCTPPPHYSMAEQPWRWCCTPLLGLQSHWLSTRSMMKSSLLVRLLPHTPHTHTHKHTHAHCDTCTHTQTHPPTHTHTHTHTHAHTHTQYTVLCPVCFSSGVVHRVP